MPESQSFQGLLQQEIEVVKELNSLSLLKKEALLKDDLDELQVIVLKEEALSLKLQKLDDACSPQVQFFLRGDSRLNQPGARRLDEKTKGLIEELRQNALQLKLNNEFNQDLLRDALAVVEFTVNALMPQLGAENGFYEATGKVAKDRRNSKKTLILDYKG